MDRRNFLRISAAGVAGLALADKLSLAQAAGRKDSGYSVVIVGDTHYDALPDTIYHEGYSDPKPSREALHRAEFVRNADMWESRLPRLVKRAACLAAADTRMVFQMGDLIQGDTGNAESHMKMLDDAFNRIHGEFDPLPMVTVIGNHDCRGKDDAVAYQAYKDYMLPKLGSQLGKKLEKTTFDFSIGKDAFIVVDFTHPDDAEVEALLEKNRKARYIFVIMHCPVLPYDDVKYGDWVFHCRKEDGTARKHFRELFAKHNVIVLCGHTHATEFADWHGDGGRITQMTMNSVWKNPDAKFVADATKPEDYGHITLKAYKAQNKGVKAERVELLDEYRPGLRQYFHAVIGGSYKLNVSEKGVTVDFYAGDSTRPSKSFVLR